MQLSHVAYTCLISCPWKPKKRKTNCRHVVKIIPMKALPYFGCLTLIRKYSLRKPTHSESLHQAIDFGTSGTPRSGWTWWRKDNTFVTKSGCTEPSALTASNVSSNLWHSVHMFDNWLKVLKLGYFRPSPAIHGSLCSSSSRAAREVDIFLTV